jgi:uncharacterized membrane protein
MENLNKLVFVNNNWLNDPKIDETLILILLLVKIIW